VIQIESITITEVRGLRDLTLNFGTKSFVISGPNGSGKSGVVDAIEFCLTGEITRLTGRGTAGVTLQRHGPHVNHRDDPSSAEVSMKLMLTKLGKEVTITRNMKRPGELDIEPEEPAVRKELDEVAKHPEIVLSRREIMKFISIEASERSKEVQALLRLDRIGQIRSTLGTAHNKLKQQTEHSRQNRQNAVDALNRHLEIDSASAENILASVNMRRGALGLVEITTLAAHTKLDEGVEAQGATSTFNKDSALRDLDALDDAIKEPPHTATDEVDRVLEDIQAIEDDPTLLQLVQKEAFLQQGLELVDSEFCPLCDWEWADMEVLRTHIREKVMLSASAGERRNRMLKDGGEIVREARSMSALLAPVITLAKNADEEEIRARFQAWSTDLEEFANSLVALDGLLSAKDRLTIGWSQQPATLHEELEVLRAAVKAKPDQSARVNAQTFLVRAQDRYVDARKARQTVQLAEKAEKAAETASTTFNRVSETALTSMYDAVQENFSEYYKTINTGDEVGFKARLEQGAGKLDLSVDFYGRGMFPPGAYHSEGHQDGMGVCLYLALMKHFFGKDFSFAVLDDVVMSIDSGHRKQFCRLLRETFPDTQFIITTHDEIWARQMRSSRLVAPSASIEFQGWDVDTGPIFEPVSEVWDRIDNDLAKNDVPAAAGRLRRHLEYTSKELADLLGARVQFKGDASYDLGDLFPSVVGRHGDLLKLASAAANSWNDADAKAKVDALKKRRQDAIASYGDEQWVVNRAVHFNEWATFSKADFTPVVKAVRALLEQFQCEKCGSWLYPLPKREEESLRCDCGANNINLKKK